MQLMPLQLPPGVWASGTDLESSGRWLDASLVRWNQGTLQPIGGWVERYDTALAKAPRASYAWEDNTQGSHIAVGFHDSLYEINASNILTDITPVGLTAGNADALTNTAYGGQAYGSGAYGVTRQSSGVFQEADTWALANWGENLVGCLTSDGKLYEWPLSGVATQIANSPTSCRALIVTGERFLFALAAGGNPRKVAWCDREDNTTWTAALDNEAGDFEIQTSGSIMCGLGLRNSTLILTSTDAHLATYQGPPFVYGFERVGSACGAISRKAAVSVDHGAYWMGRRKFHFFDGTSVRELRCDVVRKVFDDINLNQVSKTWAMHNSMHSEVWWFFPSAGALEVDRYVSYNYAEDHWSVGEMDRTTGFDRGVFSSPIMYDANAVSYNHEIGNMHGTQTPFAESGPVSIGNGDQVMKCVQLIPDELTQGDVNLTFKTRFHPNNIERDYGPFAPSNPTSVRFTGRQVRMLVEGNRDAPWKVGVMRLQVTPGGRR